MRSEKTVRVAMIGAGKLSTAMHYPSLASFDDVEFAAICDLSPERMHATADTYRIERRYLDYRRMIEEVAPDAVYAVGPPSDMYPIWVWCLEQGLHLFVEKPLGTTLRQAESLAELAAEHGCITQTGFQRRNCPIAVLLRDECLKRGPITHAVCRFYKCQMKPMLGILDHLLEDGVHAVDTLRWLCGGDVVDMHVLARRVGVADVNFYSAILQFDTGATGVMLLSWSSGRRIFDVEMHAPGVCAEVELEARGHLYADGDTKGFEYDTRQVAGSDEVWVFGGFRSKDREFIDCVKSGTQPSSHFGDALKTMRLTHRIAAKALLAE